MAGHHSFDCAIARVNHTTIVGDRTERLGQVVLSSTVLASTNRPSQDISLSNSSFVTALLHFRPIHISVHRSPLVTSITSLCANLTMTMMRIEFPYPSYIENLRRKNCIKFKAASRGISYLESKMLFGLCQK